MFKEIYEKILDAEEPFLEPNDADEFEICCPFHDDTNPSLSINDKTGAWFCFSCAKGGGVVEFVQELKGWGKQKATKWINRTFPVLGGKKLTAGGKKKEKKPLPPIDSAKIKQWHKMLMNSKKILDFLLNKRGLLPATLEEFEIGWDGERITIPVKDEKGFYRNVRRYLPNSPSKDKFVSYKAGYGSARLFPTKSFKSDTILFCEGEMDCILANQLGYDAMTATGGAGTWKTEWVPYFKDKIVNIVYDIDEEGRAGAERVAKAISAVAREVKIIKLPIVEPPHADLTDYLVTYGHTKDDLDKLIEQTEPYKQPPKHPTTITDDAIYKVHLSQASNSDYYFKNIETNVVVSGKDLAPYLVPKVVKLECSADGGKSCALCALGLAGGQSDLRIEPTDAGILQLIDCSETQQKGYLRIRAGIPKNCGRYHATVVESQNVEEISIMPELDFSSQEREYVIRRAFYVGHGLSPNASYKLNAITVPDPWRQYATHIIYEAVPSQDNISSFQMNPVKREALEIFCPAEGQTVKEKFDEIHEDLTYNVTHIYGREDLLVALDLVYHSALAFNFQKQYVHRGWVEALVIGDTRTGKSETALALMGHYKLGELVTAENTSFAGLIGGMQQTQKRWSITWGKIPLNDRRLVILDEASGLSEDSISYMSGVRSSGVAEITKIQTEKTHARTRMIWISNARDGRPLQEYGYGVHAIRRLIGKSEDIARFEFALTCASEEVPMELINRKVEDHGKVPHRYTYNLCKDLILWVWSRTPEQIIFEDEAVTDILDYATSMGEEYSSKIPLVEGANQRIKLARMAIATAGRMFSASEDGECLIVKPEHVEFAHDYLQYVYRKPSMGYYEYSKQLLESEQIAVEKAGEVKLFLDNKPELGELFLQYEYITISDMEYITDQERSDVKNDIKFLAKNRMIVKTKSGFRKSSAFSKILKEWKDTPNSHSF